MALAGANTHPSLVRVWRERFAFCNFGSLGNLCDGQRGKLKWRVELANGGCNSRERFKMKGNEFPLSPLRYYSHVNN